MLVQNMFLDLRNKCNHYRTRTLSCLMASLYWIFGCCQKELLISLTKKCSGIHTVVLNVLFSLTKEAVHVVQCLSQILAVLGHFLDDDYFLLFHTPDQHDLVKHSPLQAKTHHF